MRIRTLELRCYGPFKDQVLDFGDGTGLHLVYGPNEAGKSSALSALCEFLFGIPRVTRGNFRYANRDLRIGAVLELEGGERLHCVRRKGNRSTLLDANDEAQAIDESLLAGELGGISADQFARQFGIDYERLHSGGEEIVQGKGDLREALFAAAGGLHRLHEVRQKLDEESKQLFLTRGSRPAVNAALEAFKQQQKRARELILPSERWEQFNRELGELRGRRETLDAELRRLEDQRRWFQKVLDAVPLIAQRRTLVDALAEVADAPRLTADFSERRRKAVTGVQIAQANRREAEQTLSSLEDQIERLDVPRALLDCAPDIERLMQQLGRYRESASDRQSLVARCASIQRDIERLVRELGRENEQGQTEYVPITREQQQRIRDLGTQRSKFDAEVDGALRNIARLKGELERAAHGLAAMDPPADMQPLEAVVRYVQKHQNVEADLQRKRQEMEARQRDVDRRIETLPRWSGGLEELERLQVPPEEAIARYRRELDALQEETRRVQERYREFAERAEELQREIARLKQMHAVPSEADLTEARSDRDRVWETIRDALEKPFGDEDRQSTDWAGRHALVQEYAELVRRADDIADRLRRDAELVAQVSQLDAERCRHRERSVASERRLKELEKRRGELLDAWRSLWETDRIDPLTPDEMMDWRSQWEELLQAAGQLRTVASEVQSLAERSTELRSRLEQAMRGAGLETVDEVPLGELIEQAQLAIEQVRQLRQQRRELERDQQRLTLELSAAQQALTAARTRLEAWTQQWAEAVAALRLEGDVSPNQANAVLEAIRELNLKFQEVVELKADIEAIDRERARFRDEVADVVRRAESDLRNLDPDAVVVELSKRLNEVQRAEAQRAEKQEQRLQAAERRRAAEQDLQRWTAEVKVLCQEAGCARPEELPGREQQADQRASIERQLQAIETQLRRSAGEATLEEFSQQVLQLDADRLPGQIQDLENRIDQVRSELEAVNRRIGSHENELQRMDGTAAAAEARQEAERLWATIQEQTRAYVRLQLASAVLERAMENYRSKNQGAVLEQASGLFQTLTLGAFQGVQTDYGQSDNLVIVGVRPDGSTVGAEGMSDGTRDQLYLALRIATLQRRLAAGQRLPFVVDDVLIKFDDDRAAAALKILADLSTRTQVIYFTHHEHLVELARTAVGDKGLCIHRLGSPAIRSAGPAS